MKLPKKLIRISDGEVFVRNRDSTYSNSWMKKTFPKHYRHKWTYHTLMWLYEGYFRHG